jgi:hypothetical protein
MLILKVYVQQNFKKKNKNKYFLIIINFEFSINRLE